MGHERIGFLPKTEKWRNIVEALGNFSNNKITINDISARTLENVRSRLLEVEKDESFLGVFQFMVDFSKSFANKKIKSDLKKSLTSYDAFYLAKYLRDLSRTFNGSAEYREMAFFSAVDAFNIFYHSNITKQEDLFKPITEPEEVWTKLGSGSGFCELSRLFFAKFTEKYLNYFLERSASSEIYDLDNRERFRLELERHLDKISHHAFETAKITQSFAAGWYNKHLQDVEVDYGSLKSFVRMALGKIREELRREALK